MLCCYIFVLLFCHVVTHYILLLHFLCCVDILLWSYIYLAIAVLLLLCCHVPTSHSTYIMMTHFKSLYPSDNKIMCVLKKNKSAGLKGLLFLDTTTVEGSRRAWHWKGQVDEFINEHDDGPKIKDIADKNHFGEWCQQRVKQKLNLTTSHKLAVSARNRIDAIKSIHGLLEQLGHRFCKCHQLSLGKYVHQSVFAAQTDEYIFF